MNLFLKASLFVAAATLPTVVQSHGYLKSPRSRNLVANEDGLDFGGGASDPVKEYCPHCLNRKTTNGACGATDGRDYDFPQNRLGGNMPRNIQATYNRGGTIDVEVVLTAHHKGHFSFYACPVANGQAPNDSCFKANPLEFVQDLLHGAPKDPNYPERAYIPPRELSQVDNSGVESGWLYRYRMKLPANVQGDTVLLQWQYVTGNSCTAVGTRNYNLPSSWGDMGYNAIPQCGSLPADGNGTPEQFWNCAEVAINGDGGGGGGGSSDSCGGGSRGNGQCADGTCCSEHGWCGTSPAHCSGGGGGGGGSVVTDCGCGGPCTAALENEAMDDSGSHSCRARINEVMSELDMSETDSCAFVGMEFPAECGSCYPDTCNSGGGGGGGGGTCGGGSRGDGQCADGTCCSEYGWCGTSSAHCGDGGSSTPGTCGNGSRGNGRCADGTCCSQYGWCGTSSAHCN